MLKNAKNYISLNKMKQKIEKEETLKNINNGGEKVVSFIPNTFHKHHFTKNT
jgi:hypothetical protein